MSRVWCGRMPSWPSIPGTMTMSTSSVKARRSGETISSCSGIGQPMLSAFWATSSIVPAR